MGCFIVPATAGIFTTGLRKKVPAHLHIGWLNTMIWGSTVGFVVDHIANKEIVMQFPFFTGNPALILREMASIGIPILAALIFVWLAAVVVYEKFAASASKPADTK
jgi:hypothetical protein